MVGHIVYCNQLLFLSRDDAGDIFLQFVVAFRLDEALPAFNGEHDVDINLRVGIGHAPRMPLLAELENHFIYVLQRCHAYGASRGNYNDIKIHVGIAFVLAYPPNLPISCDFPLWQGRFEMVSNEILCDLSQRI